MTDQPQIQFSVIASRQEGKTGIGILIDDNHFEFGLTLTNQGIQQFFQFPDASEGSDDQRKCRSDPLRLPRRRNGNAGGALLPDPLFRFRSRNTIGQQRPTEEKHSLLRILFDLIHFRTSLSSSAL